LARGVRAAAGTGRARRVQHGDLGQAYARHGTTTDTRLTVIDRVPADDPKLFPASIGLAADAVTLLDWVTRLGMTRLLELRIQVLRSGAGWAAAGPSRPATRSPWLAAASLRRAG